MSSYLELPTYTYDKMSINETRLFRRDLKTRCYTRIVYPTAKNMSIDAVFRCLVILSADGDV